MMDSKGTWTLANEISGAFTGLPCCWNAAGWKRGLPEPAGQLLGKGAGGAAGAVAGSPAGAIKGAEVTVVGKAAPGNTEGVARPWVAVPLASSRSCPNASILCDILLPTDEVKYPGAAGIVLGGPTGAAGPAGNTNGAEFGAGMPGAA